jgi:hypothetical protein
LQKT